MEDEINQAVKIIESGGIVCLPTDTQFGLSVDYKNDLALQKLINLKYPKYWCAVSKTI